MTSRHARFTMISAIVLFVGVAVAFGLASQPIAIAPPLVRPAPIASPGTIREIVLEGVVSEYHPAEPGDVVDAIGTHVMDKIWLVTLAQITVIEGEWPEKTITILVHSPSMDLGVKQPGQTIRVGLTPLNEPLKIVVSPSRATLGFPDLSRVKYELNR